MSMLGIKLTLKRYFGCNIGLTCIICILIFCVYFFVVKLQKRRGQRLSGKELFYGLILSIYLSFMINWTMLNRSIGDEWRVKLVPFWSYRELWLNREMAIFIQIVANVLLFIPWGILFTIVSNTMKKFWYNVGSAMMFSLVLEIMQFVFRCGLFEFDDIFHNTLGAIIGYGIWQGVKIFKRI